MKIVPSAGITPYHSAHWFALPCAAVILVTFEIVELLRS
jgi:hypothetical protein